MYSAVYVLDIPQSSVVAFRAPPPNTTSPTVHLVMFRVHRMQPVVDSSCLMLSVGLWPMHVVLNNVVEVIDNWCMLWCRLLPIVDPKLHLRHRKTNFVMHRNYISWRPIPSFCFWLIVSLYFTFAISPSVLIKIGLESSPKPASVTALTTILYSLSYFRFLMAADIKFESPSWHAYKQKFNLITYKTTLCCVYNKVKLIRFLEGIYRKLCKYVN